jgi:DNA-3-methyladenine glycosylase II
MSKEAIEHLSNLPHFKKIIASIGELAIKEEANVFLKLVRSVAGQQLSTKAAASIFDKFLKLVGQNNPKPQDILKLKLEDLRNAGFSYNKGQYVLNIAQFWLDNKLTDTKLQQLDDEELLNLLTQIKGVGTWTVQMLMMFTLGRSNIFAVDDLGIQQGMALMYKWEGVTLKELKLKMLHQSKKYAPHNTIACMYIWRWKDGIKKGI